MNQQEWIEYFELVNGRKPTPAELAFNDLMSLAQMDR